MLASRLQSFEDMFNQSGAQLSDVVSARGDAAREVIAARLQAFEDLFSRGSERLSDVIGGRGDAGHEMLVGRLRAFEGTFQNGRAEPAEPNSRDSATPRHVLNRQLFQLDSPA